MGKIIYTLVCPITNRPHYVGCSSIGMTRPLQHLKESHSVKIKEWVEDLRLLGYKPKIQIIENVTLSDDIFIREKYWIHYMLSKGEALLNQQSITPPMISQDLIADISDDEYDAFKSVGKFIAKKRRQLELTQYDFSEKMGISLTVIRKIEQGKRNYIIESLLDCLAMFGCTISVKRISRDR